MCASADNSVAQNILAGCGIIRDVFGAAAGHVYGWEDAFVQLIVNVHAELLKAVNDLLLAFYDSGFILLLPHISARS
jgi:hypothetical protein